MSVPTVAIPFGSLDRFRAWIEDTAHSAAERREIVAIGDSTTFGSVLGGGGVDYSWLQRIRDRIVSAGYSDGGKGIFAGGESTVTYDSPEINGYVSSTWAGSPDAFDTLNGQYYYDTGAAPNHALTLQFKGTCFRLWYSARTGAGSFTYAIDGGSTVRVDAHDETANGPYMRFVYVSGLSDTTHTIVITNLAGRPAAAPVGLAAASYGNGAGSYPAGTWWYAVSAVFGGGETLISTPIQYTNTNNTNIAVNFTKNGADSYNLYRCATQNGTYTLSDATSVSRSSTTQGFDITGANTFNNGNAPVSGTSNLNTSAKGAWVAFAPMYAVGVSLQKQSTSGATMDSFAHESSPGVDQEVWRTAPALGLRATGVADLQDPTAWEVDPTVVSGTVDPILAILDLGFNDMTVSNPVATITRGVERFAAMCQVAEVDGIVISGNFPPNANFATLGDDYMEALYETAIDNGLAFVDFWNGPFEGVDMSGVSQPHLTKAQYQTQADWLWNNVLAPSRIDEDLMLLLGGAVS